MSVIHLYIADDGGTIVPLPVAVRAGTVLPKDATEHRPFTFTPMDAEGRKVSVSKFTLTPEEFGSWMSAATPQDRTAALVGKSSKEQASAIRPTVAQLRRVKADIPAAYDDAFWAAGTFALVSDAAESSAKSKRGTLAERKVAAVSALMDIDAYAPPTAAASATGKAGKVAQ